MSTKIYNGFKFTSTNLWTVHQQLAAFRPVIHALIRQETARFCALQATGLIDKAAMGGEGVRSPLWSAVCELHDRQREIKKTGHRDPGVDFEFNVVVLPFECAVYGIIYTERSAWQRLFIEQTWTQEFAYWDNSDPPDGCSDADWAARGNLWDRLLAQDTMSRPGQCGFSVEMIAPYFHPTAEEALPFVPSLTHRAELLAKSRIRNEIAKPLYERAAAEGKQAGPFDVFWEAELELKTEEGKARVKAEADRLTSILPEISVETLKRSPVGAASAA